MTLNRRHALKTTLATLLTTITGCARSETLKGSKIIVVGGGLAGLAAAQTLQSQGANVTTLEAGNKIGGRVRTDTSMGTPFEHGAAWIHGPSPDNPIRQLADQTGASLFLTDYDNIELFEPNGDPANVDTYNRLDAMSRKLYRKLLDDDISNDPRSLQTLARDLDRNSFNSPLGQWFLSTDFEFDLGTDLNNISAANALGSSGYPGEDVIILEGYNSLLKPLAQNLDIRLNTKVSEINTHTNNVSIQANTEQNTTHLNADYVICTVPLGVLKAGTIKFDPALPNNLQQAIRQIGFGTVTKIALKFNSTFWDTSTQFFGIMTEPRSRWNYWMNYRTFSDQNILTGFSFGDYAIRADAMTQQAMTDDAIATLRTVWGNDVTSPTDIITTHWSQDPNFLGAYSYPQTGGNSAQHAAFKQTVNNRLLFAGEHTTFTHHSTTYGALLSGQRAANTILQNQ